MILGTCFFMILIILGSARMERISKAGSNGEKREGKKGDNLFGDGISKKKHLCIRVYKLILSHHTKGNLILPRNEGRAPLKKN